MQKIALGKIIREEFVRAIAFSLSLFVLLFAGFGTLAYAASDGGIFGQVLNSILASGDWQSPGDGTVKNAAKLGGKNASAFVQVPAGGLTCGIGKCINRIDTNGNPQCEP